MAVATCPASVTLECPADTSVAANGTATGADNCPGVLVSSGDVTADGCANTKVVTRTWKAVDTSGKSAVCVQTITVDDTTAPVIETCPADQDYECGPDPANLMAGQTAREDWKFPGSSIAGFLEFGGVARDNCDDELEASYELIGPVGTCPKVWTLVWTVSDDCNNSDTCTQTARN